MKLIIKNNNNDADNNVDKWTCNVLTWPSELSITTLPNVDKQQLYPIIEKCNITDKEFILEQLQ